jgi:hypothetical protein
MTPELIVTGEAAEHRLPDKPTNAWRPFLPVRVSASVSPATALNPIASSSSRYANNPASDVTTDPQNCSISRRSKSSLRTPSFGSPIGCAVIASLDLG